ncbi:MAG TPA: hypothetical protein VLL52_01605, partial [Anaerolineae bacterium]|nr:hypothetical protein [Anaerolineae bacterium]
MMFFRPFVRTLLLIILLALASCADTPPDEATPANSQPDPPVTTAASLPPTPTHTPRPTLTATPPPITATPDDIP